jgi:hypothetical protein
MIKCPFCHYENEDGALFCERCSSDLSGVASSNPPVPAIPVAAEPDPMVLDSAEPVAGSNPFVFGEAVAEPVEEPYGESVPLQFAESVTEPEPVPAPPPPVPEPPLVTPVPVSEVPEPVSEPAPAPPVVPPAPEPAPPILPLGTIPPGAQPKLQVLRGQKRNVEYPIYEGLNYIGRADEKPVDIDLEEQEPPDRIWCSRQHAVLTFEGTSLAIEDLNSANGTYVNRTRVYPGQQKPLAINDIVQIGNVQLKVII